MTENAPKPLKITDTILRDAHQSLLATRMRTEDMLPIAPKLDQVGYFSLEMWGGATFDTCLRFLNENPWDRVRKLKQVMPKTPFQMLLRGQNLVGYRHYADDIIERFVKKSADVGIDIFRIFDALNDFRNIELSMRIAQKCGKKVEGTISYTVSPVHKVELYVKMAKQMENMGADILCIKDMAGLLTPQVTKVLVEEIKKTIKIPVHLHTHATTGLVGMNLQCAIDSGVDIIDTAISTMAMGTSQYATECIVAALQGGPRDTGLNLPLLDEIADYIKEIRKKYSQFESDYKGVDIRILESQIPGGMISNMENQLKEQNALDKLDEVLKEVPRVRKDMGYPPLVTPTSQIVGSQATLNVLTGERYKIITKETRECVLGKYGKLPAPIDPALFEKAAKEEKIIECRPADLLPPEWENAGKECAGKVAEEEDILSYALFPKVALKFFETRENGGLAIPVLAPEKPKPAAPPAPPPASSPAPVPTPTANASAPATPPPPPAPANSGSAIYTVSVNGKVYSVEVALAGGAGLPVASPNPATAAKIAPPPSVTIKETVTTKLPGTIISIKVQEGASVNEGDTLIILESMKMETEIKSHCNGIIGTLLVKEGASVQTGDELIYIA